MIQQMYKKKQIFCPRRREAVRTSIEMAGEEHYVLRSQGCKMIKKEWLLSDTKSKAIGSTA